MKQKFLLLLGLLAIWLWDKGRCPKWCKVCGIVGLCLISFIGDWMCFNVLWCLFFFVYRDRPKDKWFAFSAVALSCCLLDRLLSGAWWRSLFQLGIFLVPLLLHFGYNGEPGSKRAVHKWFFYVFYPAHLLVLTLLKAFLL